MNAVYLALSVMYLLLIVYSFVAPKKIYSFNSWQGALAAIGLSSTAVIATVWFIFWRFRRARSYYLRKAKRFPGELVKPGSIIGEVVGRDQLCDALMNDLRDRRQRRPHVIVGTLGVGKTALLVRLTQRLARKGVVPVVLQLRDVRDVREFNFSKLAARKFCAEVLERVSSRGEAEKIWQRLRHTQDRAVVLADGLEDALKGADDRDNKIRKAINDAREAKLPLVMTSRPQKSLEAIDAAQTVLEPLSEEAALRYVAEGSNWRSNRQRMDWVVEAAEIAESPIYLNIAKDLELRGLLEPIVGGGEDEKCDPRDQDVWTLRYDLLDAWIQALVKGHLYPEQPLSYKGRFTTVEYLSVLACAALHTNSTYVGYGALTATPAAAADASGEGGASGGSGGTGKALVVGALRARLRKRLESVADGCDAGDGPAGNFDERLAGSWGSRLGLVEEQGEGVRFHHSVLQAYLASRYMDALVRCEETVRPPRSEAVAAASSTARAGGRPPNDPQPVPAPSAPSVEEAYFGQALQRPGRELAMALVFYSRSMEALQGDHGQRGSDTHGTDGHGSDAHGTDAHGTDAHGTDAHDIDDCPIGIVRDRLEEAAGRALQGGSAQAAGAGRDDAGSGDIEQDPKIRALELYSAALDVDSFHHRPRHHDIVQAVRDGWEKLQVYNDRKLDAPKKALIQRIGATGRLLSKRHALPPWDVQEVQGETAYAHLFEIAGKEPSHSVRFIIAQAIGEGGDDAYRTLECELFNEVFYAFPHRPGASEAVSKSTSGSPGTCEADGPPSAPGTTRTERLLRKERARRLSKHQRDEEAAEQREREAEEREHRKEIMRAWLAPMLVRSCSFTPHRSTPYELLSWWMERLRDGRVDLRQQVALAQGFRQAANHRTPPTEPARARDFLNEQAWKMLKYTRYWFARLVLLHALTLWALPDDITQRQPRHGHGARPARQMRQWLEQGADPAGRRKRHEEHPLVGAAGKLARQALQTRRPDRFLWIDEVGTASQIGSETSSPGEQRMHNLWIPPSRGWSTLDPDAQQLLADVLVLLILTEERGDRPKDALLRLKHAYSGEQNRLPPCLARDRTPLNPLQALVGETPCSLPGSNCADGCPFEFCPYPPKGPQCRTELNELFCIQQSSLLSPLQFQAWRFLRFRRRARWQRKVPVKNLLRFWDEMGARARNHSLKEASF